MIYFFIDGIAGSSDDSENVVMDVAGRKHEMATDGGEVSFVIKIIKESKLYKSNIKIFTAMLGRKKSVQELRKILKNDIEVKSVAVSEFCQGRIMRWGLAWTFQSDIKLENAMPSHFAKTKQEQKQNIPFSIIIEKDGRFCNIHKVLEIISDLLTSDLMVTDKHNEKVDMEVCVVRFKLFKPTWRNQRTKKRQAERLLEGPSNKKRKIDIEDDVNAELLLDVLLTITSTENDGAEKIEINFVCRDGVLGRGGLYELVQYFRNKLK